MTGKIKKHGKSEMDMVPMLFGMDNPISIETVNKKGEIQANLANTTIDHISEDNRSMSMGSRLVSTHY